MEDPSERAPESDVGEEPVAVDEDVDDQENEEGGLEVAGKRRGKSAEAAGQQPLFGQPLLDGGGPDQLPTELRGVDLHEAEQWRELPRSWRGDNVHQQPDQAAQGGDQGDTEAQILGRQTEVQGSLKTVWYKGKNNIL